MNDQCSRTRAAKLARTHDVVAKSLLKPIPKEDPMLDPRILLLAPVSDLVLALPMDLTDDVPCDVTTKCENWKIG